MSVKVKNLPLLKRQKRHIMCVRLKFKRVCPWVGRLRYAGLIPLGGQSPQYHVFKVRNAIYSGFVFISLKLHGDLICTQLHTDFVDIDSEVN
jgi:hypothetical protein